MPSSPSSPRPSSPTPPPARHGGALSRRRFLGGAAAGAAGLALTGLAACGGADDGGSGDGPLVLAVTPDIAKMIKEPIARFTKENPATPVTVRTMPVDSSQFFDQIRTQMQAGSSDIDVFEGDITWAAQFAPNGWLTDLSDRFTPAARASYLPAGVGANTVKGKVYGVPMFWDSGLLYYRADLLERAGYSEPPATWDELQAMAAKISRDRRIKHGFVFQGAQYEGGTVNGLEYIRSCGGDVLTGGRVTVTSAPALRGLRIERSMVDKGIAPAAVAQYKEDESGGAFLGGDAVFARTWAYLYGLVTDKSQSAITRGQVGIAELPVADAGMKRTNVGGGWNLMINANSRRKDAGWKLITFLAAPERQKALAIDGQYLPTIPALYGDPAIRKAMPVIAHAKQAIEHTTTPPGLPYYSDMSLAMAKYFNASLRGAMTPDQAAERLQSELQRIVEQS